MTKKKKKKNTSSIRNNALHYLTLHKLLLALWVQEIFNYIFKLSREMNILPVKEIPRLIVRKRYSFNYECQTYPIEKCMQWSCGKWSWVHSDL